MKMNKQQLLKQYMNDIRRLAPKFAATITCEYLNGKYGTEFLPADLTAFCKKYAISTAKPAEFQQNIIAMIIAAEQN